MVSTLEVEGAGGARAVEIAAMLGDSVVGVKHCMNPRSAQVTAMTWSCIGLACFLTSGIAFAVSVNDAATNTEALDDHTRVQHKPAYAFRPVASHAGLDYLTCGGLALGLLGVTAALARMRNAKQSPYYRVGTAPGVEQPLATAPAPSFPLIAPSGDDFVFNYAPGIDGEVLADGRWTPLCELAATGRARSSATAAGAFELTIRPTSRIRARSGSSTFLISSVAQPRGGAARWFKLEKRDLGYLAGSVALHLGVWAVLQTIPAEDSGVDVELANAISIGEWNDVTDEDVPEPETPRARRRSEQASANMRIDHRLPDSWPSARIEPALAREEAVEMARASGLLGPASSLNDLASLTASTDFSSGFESTDVNCLLGEGCGEDNGFGLGVHGVATCGSSGCNAGGTVGTGRYGTVGTDLTVGDRWGRSSLRNHVATDPCGGTGGCAVMSAPNVHGDLDRSIIRRYVARSVRKISYCYEKELFANPTLAGTVAVQFLIAPNGTVQAITAIGLDGVYSCVADTIKAIKFPAPRNGGSVQVHYPFHFHPSGQ